MSQLSELIKRIDAYTNQRLEESGVPGCSIMLTDRQETLHQAGHGVVDLGSRAPVTTETLFEFGSASKVFLVTVIMQLVERGELSLDDPIQKHLPWFEVPTANNQPITLHLIMSHQAGLVVGCDCAPNSRRGVWDQRFTPVPVKPGVAHHYSNLGFEALGYMLEDKFNMSLEQVLQEWVLKPMGMVRTEAAATNAVRPRMATGYNPLLDEIPRKPGDPIAPAPFHELRSACGSIITCATDLGPWLRMFLNRGKGLVSEESFAKMGVQHSDPGHGSYYGYGLRLRRFDDQWTMGHTGGMVGYASDFAVDLDHGVGAAVLLNAPGPVDWIATDIITYAHRLLRAFKKGEMLAPIPPRLNWTAVANAEEFAGSYTTGEKSFDLVAEDGRLVMKHDGGSMPLWFDVTDRFWLPDPPFNRFLMYFRRENGRVVAAAHGPDFYWNERYTGPNSWERPDHWDAFAGLYRSFLPWDTNFHVFPRRDELVIIAPRCFGREQPMRPLHEPNLFGLGGEHNPEWVRFDTEINGRAHRALLSGVEYHRMP